MVLLPAVALIWVLVHHLGRKQALLVVGLHSVLFCVFGQGRPRVPLQYGRAGWIRGVHTGHLLLQVASAAVHAYIIPTGLGILVLQELFRHRIKPDAKNWIRLVTLMAMLGSSDTTR